MIKLPKGTQDYSGESYAKLEYLKNVITKLFKKYHGEFVETPVFELTNVLMDKYGEEEKLIYNIEGEGEGEGEVEKDDEKERISLRYDHTVPLVRYCISNRIVKLRRCCIGKVYRRESTIRSQIRLREFYQADFDYVGNFDELIPELEIFCMIQELFKTLNICNYEILYNYRQNLDYYVKEAGINIKFSNVCSSIDKLDKRDKEYVRKELIEKGVTNEQVDKLYSFLFDDSSEGYIMSPLVRDLDKKFIHYIDLIGILDKSKIKFVPTLARGSDYYTGIIFEVKLINSEFASSVSGGGRYDKLIPSYKKNENIDIKDDFPTIGFSFGVDRLIPLITLPKLEKIIKIWVSTIRINNEDSIKIKLDLVGKFSQKGYGVFYNLSTRKFNKEIADADENGCNFIVIIGETELAEKNVTIKNMMKREQTTIPFNQIDEYFNTCFN
jgi:histidyl-tRNA synthetase